MKWELSTTDRNIIDLLTKECNITELQAKLLFNRGIRTIDEANLYLNGGIDDLLDPSTLSGIEEAVDILEYAYKNKLKICIAGDYDMDGIASECTTYKALDNLGIEVDYYIPHRVKEGYGLSISAVESIAKKGFDIIYTVDNGIAAVNEVKRAKELGLKVLVTDHHDIPAILPEADAIVNPKLKDCKYPNKDLCGCSVSWKVLFHLYNRLGESLEYLYDLLPFVAIATIGDMMNLNGENRIIVKEGIKRINQGVSFGLNKLKELYKIDEINSGDIAFKIVPTANADGRLEDAYTATNFLLCKDISELQEIIRIYATNVKRELIKSDSTLKVTYRMVEDLGQDISLSDNDEETIIKLANKVFGNLHDLNAHDIFIKSRRYLGQRIKEIEEMANTLYQTNEKRKDLTVQYMEECLDIIKRDKLDKYEVIVVVHEEIPEGLVGLVAGRIKEKYQKPTFVFSNAEEYYKGSGRGVEGHPLSLFEGLNLTKDLWVKGGGHPMAAGVSFEKDMNKLFEFRDRLSKYTQELFKQTIFEPSMKIDALINNPTEDLCREIEILQPTGKGNPNAIFGTDMLNILEAKPVGDGSHLRLKLTNNITGIGFSLTNRYNELNNPSKIKIAYTPSINVYSFNDQRTGKEITLRNVQMMIKDINLSTDVVKTNKKLLISSIKQSVISRKMQ